MGMPPRIILQVVYPNWSFFTPATATMNACKQGTLAYPVRAWISKEAAGEIRGWRARPAVREAHADRVALSGLRQKETEPNGGYLMDRLYTATVTVKGGREGKLSSSDGVLNLELRMPKELGGSGGAATNPEQLFAAGYAACFESALNLVCRTKKVKYDGTEVTAHVGIGKDADGGFALAVELDVSLQGVAPEEANELIKAADQVCPYSKATRGNIDVRLRLV